MNATCSANTSHPQQAFSHNDYGTEAIKQMTHDAHGRLRAQCLDMFQRTTELTKLPRPFAMRTVSARNHNTGRAHPDMSTSIHFPCPLSCRADYLRAESGYILSSVSYVIGLERHPGLGVYRNIGDWSTDRLARLSPNFVKNPH